jgi:hypothetical protein
LDSIKWKRLISITQTLTLFDLPPQNLALALPVLCGPIIAREEEEGFKTNMPGSAYTFVEPFLAGWNEQLKTGPQCSVVTGLSAATLSRCSQGHCQCVEMDLEDRRATKKLSKKVEKGVVSK